MTISIQLPSDVEKLDKPVQRRIAAFLQSRLVSLDDPRQLGKALQGQYAGYWRYRVGDYSPDLPF